MFCISVFKKINKEEVMTQYIFMLIYIPEYDIVCLMHLYGFFYRRRFGSQAFRSSSLAESRPEQLECRTSASYVIQE